MSTDSAKKWQLKHPEEVKAYQKRYRAENREKLNAQSREYRRTHLEERIERQRKWYEENRERIIAERRKTNAVYVARNKAFMVEWYSSHPCVDCGETDMAVLESDHVRGKKQNCIGNLVHQGYPLERVKTELEKCETRCANCHKRATDRRRLTQPRRFKCYLPATATL